MKITFSLDYHTSFGETLVLNVITGGKPQAHAMTTTDGRLWTLELRPAQRTTVLIEYFYTVERSGREWRREWTSVPHRLELADTRAACYFASDLWRDIPDGSIFCTSAFVDCVERRAIKPIEPLAHGKLLRLKVMATQLQSHERLAICGADESLGAWTVPAHLPMTEHAPGEWVASIDATPYEGRTIDFKFVIVDDRDGSIALWEQGDNRSVFVKPMQAGDVVALELPEAHFEREPWRGAGTVVPVFSLRSEGSCGVGDFGDLFAMVDWVADTGQNALQTLPVNDTTDTHRWTDSYPYNAISVMALHPIYVDLRQLAPLRDADRREHYEQERRELNALPQVDYERVDALKGAWLRELFAEQWPGVARRAAFKAFFERNKDWLAPYAAFCHYREKYGTADFSTWPDHQSPDTRELSEMATPGTKAYKAVVYWYYVQYVLHEQMARVHEHARSRRVILKGDIAIGVNRNSVETWAEPQYFHMDGQTGAPPDAFSVNGQNWGFPTYNWDAMLADGCQWWTRRLGRMAELFDAYRIDHILGFFRIWEIPSHAVNGLLGQFAPSLPMTPEEIKAYGFRLDMERMTRPHITDRALEARFGDRAEEVKATFLTATDDGYELLPQYDTERKVQAAFAERTSPDDVALRNGLYGLVSDVLFVRDRYDKLRFHPRIAAQADQAYAALDEGQKSAFNRLYDDYYYRRHNRFWYNEAMRKLPLLAGASPMLMCAEDLGMVPECVPWVMQQLKILSLEIQSMPKESGLRFGHLSHNPYLSVCTISTHDTPTLRGWWDEDEERTDEFFATRLHRNGHAPHPLPGWLAEDIVARHLMCPSALCIITLQDWMAIDEKLRLPDADAERINVPANPRHYWRYRMHITIEQLKAATRLNDTITTLIDQGGRLHRL